MYCIELVVEFGYQCGEVGVVFWFVVFDVVCYWVFLVDVDVVEYVQCCIGVVGIVGYWQVVFDVGVDV